MAAGFLVDLVAILVAMFGLALGAYLVYIIQLRMGWSHEGHMPPISAEGRYYTRASCPYSLLKNKARNLYLGLPFRWVQVV